jgi:hypothetical protein
VTLGPRELDIGLTVNFMWRLNEGEGSLTWAGGYVYLALSSVD